jgi:hypothetical protein
MTQRIAFCFQGCYKQGASRIGDTNRAHPL